MSGGVEIRGSDRLALASSRGASSQQLMRSEAFSPSRAGLSNPGADPRAAGDLFVAACVLSRNDAQVSSHRPDGQLDVVGGAGADPGELPRRVMTTHPAAVDAGTRMASGGSVESVLLQGDSAIRCTVAAPVRTFVRYLRQTSDVMARTRNNGVRKVITRYRDYAQP